MKYRVAAVVLWLAALVSITIIAIPSVNGVQTYSLNSIDLVTPEHPYGVIWLKDQPTYSWYQNTFKEVGEVRRMYDTPAVSIVYGKDSALVVVCAILAVVVFGGSGGFLWLYGKGFRFARKLV